MSEDISSEDFDRLMREMAVDLFKSAKSLVGQSASWDRAILDVRSPKDGGSRLLKFRVQMGDGSVKGAHVSSKVTSLLREMWSIRDEIFPDRWFGLQLILPGNGECETIFNYDEQCADDPS